MKYVMQTRNSYSTSIWLQNDYILLNELYSKVSLFRLIKAYYIVIYSYFHSFTSVWYLYKVYNNMDLFDLLGNLHLANQTFILSSMFKIIVSSKFHYTVMPVCFLSQKSDIYNVSWSWSCSEEFLQSRS